MSFLLISCAYSFTIVQVLSNRTLILLQLKNTVKFLSNTIHIHKSKTRLYPLLQGKGCPSSSYYGELFTLELQLFVVILTPKQQMSVSS